jgi:hypothetical protein
MLIEHAGLARGGRDVAGDDLPGRGIGRQQPPPDSVTATCWPISRVGTE